MATESATTTGQSPFIERIGLILIAPSHALGRVAKHGGGVRDALYLVVVSLLAFRVPDLVCAAAAFARISVAGGLTQLLGVVGSEVRTAGLVVLVAALAITLFSGKGRRDTSVALELGAACYVPYFFIFSPIRLLDLEALLGYVPSPVGRVVQVLAWAAVALFTVLSVRVVRGASEAPPLPEGWRGNKLGALAMAIPVAGLVLGILFSLRHYDSLRPLGRLDRAPDFSLARADGTPGSVELSQLKGKVVMLDFWATWCPPCIAMLPTLHDLYGEWHPRGVEFVGINFDGPSVDRDDLLAFLRQHRFPYPVVLDDKGVGGLYGVSSIPHLVIIGRDGMIVRVFVGGVGRSQLAAALAAATQ